MKTNMRFITWLELAALAATPAQPTSNAALALRPILANGQQRCLGVTLNDRWLRGHDGRLTVFDTLGSASRFLQLLKLDHFSMGGLYDGIGLGHIQCFRLNGQQLSSCDTELHEAAVSRANGRSAGRMRRRGEANQKFLAAALSNTRAGGMS